MRELCKTIFQGLPKDGGKGRSMTLYQINRRLEEAFYSCFDPETGEVIGDISILDDLQMAKDEKVENTACLYKNLMADAKALREEANNLIKRARTCENRAERIFNYLAEELDGEPFKSPKTAISFRESKATEILDITKIPEEFLRFSDPTADKTAIKKAIESGQEVPGAAVVLHNNMQIK